MDNFNRTTKAPDGTEIITNDEQTVLSDMTLVSFQTEKDPPTNESSIDQPNIPKPTTITKPMDPNPTENELESLSSSSSESDVYTKFQNEKGEPTKKKTNKKTTTTRPDEISLTSTRTEVCTKMNSETSSSSTPEDFGQAEGN